MEENQVSGKAVGGKARWEGKTDEERKAASMKAVEAKVAKAKLAKATHSGNLVIGDANIPCAVLEDGRRVFSESGITEALLGGRSGASKRLKTQAEEAGNFLPTFLAPGQLRPFVTDEMLSEALKPVHYVVGGSEVVGFEATALPTVCDIWLAARAAGALQTQQLEKAQKAEILMRSLAKVAVNALVDEATGYQKERLKDALAKMLEMFVAKELQPWVRTFPSEYYENLYRLYGMPWPPESNRMPQFFGTVTNNIIYSRIAPELLPELKKTAAKSGLKNAHLHRGLTREIGHPKLEKHITKVTTIMELSDNKDDFFAKLEKHLPKFGSTMQLPLNDPNKQ